MTLLNNDFETIRAVIVAIKNTHPDLTQMQMALDAKVSMNTMSALFNYPEWRPGKYVFEQLKKYVESLRQKYPEDCPQEVKPK